MCVIVLSQNKEILLGERLNGYKPGWYGMPGGRIALTETLEKAVRRELKEETGITTGELEYIGVVRELQGEYNFIHFGFVVRGTTQLPKNAEPDKCKDWAWFNPQKLPDNVLPGHRAVIEMWLEPKTKSVRDLCQ